MIKNDKNKLVVNTFQRKKALLLGNGINRTQVKDLYNWEQLLIDLSKEFSYGVINNERKDKPFPMFYEEIVNHAKRHRNIPESVVKRNVQEKLNNLEINNKFDFLQSVDCDEILTTNYDYLIEQYLQNGWKRGSTVTKQERLYSLYRFQNSGKKVWHIHGEQGDIRSMLLGFRSYLNYTSKIRDRSNLYLASFFNKEKANELEKHQSWVEMFFTHNIHIVGLGLEFTEYTIWWILAQRHYLMTTDKRINVNNEITLHLPSFINSEKLYLKEMMDAYNVKVNIVEIEERDDYDTFYEKLKHINFE